MEFSEEILKCLVKVSNETLKSLRSHGYITEKEFKYFSYENKNATNLRKLYFLPKMHKRQHNVPDRPVISN